jgi:succinate dehydrogenase/fumarate reductase flavoprotein subunit
MSASTLRRRLVDLPERASFDVVVLGAGGAGMAAALFAAIGGARVLLVESTGLVGGTTAYSQGFAWIPGTHHAGFVNPSESINDARRYLDAVVGSRGSARLREAFLQRGAAAVHRLERESLVSLRVATGQPDHHPECEGAASVGRVLEPNAFDARVLGRDFELLRPPPPEATRWNAFGGVMFDADDLAHLRRWPRSTRSWRPALELGLRHLRDRTRHARGTRLLRGNALVAQLLASLARQRVDLLTNVRATGLVEGPLGIAGVVLVHDGNMRLVHARGGVVLATGGFNRHPIQRAARLPDIDPEWCPGAPGHTGTALSLAEARGAAWGTGAVANAYLAPVSLRKRHDGSLCAYPHLDRLPRHVFVDADGDCEIDAGLPHHAAAMAMHDTMTMPVHLITDAQGMLDHGLGAVGPGGRGLEAALAEGYVRRARDVRELSHELQVPAAMLERQLQRHLRKSLMGIATAEFAPPYYAVEVVPGDVAAACGLATDESARVLDPRGEPIGGLYAVGADMHSMMGGVLPAPGCMLGPGLVFAAIAADDAVARAGRDRSNVPRTRRAAN